jgi:hypothetical protein
MVKRTTSSQADPETKARALRAARKGAGYKSASEAAAKLGFQDAKFRSQEAGSRRISDEDAAQYAAAFGVRVDDLLYPRSGDVQMVLERLHDTDRQARDQAVAVKRQIARRLKIGRIAAGFDSASAAVEEFGLTGPTYLGHENGKNALALPVARLYAALFGIREAWLLTGEPPSGLGRRFDARLDDKRDAEDYAGFRELVDPRPKLTAAKIKSLKSAVRANELPAWTENAGDIVREIRFADLRERGVAALSQGFAGYWPLPKGFARHSLNAAAEDLIVVVADEEIAQLAAGDRIFIDTSLADLREPGDFLALDGKSIVYLDTRRGRRSVSAGATVLGKVLAKFSLLR